MTMSEAIKKAAEIDQLLQPDKVKEAISEFMKLRQSVYLDSMFFDGYHALEQRISRAVDLHGSN